MTWKIVPGLMIMAAIAGGFANYEYAKYTTPSLLPAPVKPVEVEKLPTITIKNEAFHPINYSKEQRLCLALNVYHEAKNQTIEGQVAVAMVTMNRVINPKFPNNVCDVVKQAKTWKGRLIRHKCQFSWWCDGKSDKPYNKNAWETAVKISTGVIDNWRWETDMTNGALWYHADYVKPKWSYTYKPVTKIGKHIFYVRENS